MDTQNNIYIDRGHYYLGYDYFPDKQIAKENIILVDNYVYAALSDAALGNEPGLVFVERDGKQGVLTFHSGGEGGYGALVYSSNIFPFLYDEMLLNGSFDGQDIGYVAVRINHNWGILRVEGNVVDECRRAHRPCMMIIPCIYPSKEKAIAKIKPNKDYHPEFGWHNPFIEAENHRFLNLQR